MASRSKLISGQMFVLDPDIMCKCGNKATEWLEIHAVHFCTQDVQTISTFLCEGCMARDIGRAAIIANAAELVECESCGLQIVSLSDILVRHCSIEAREK